MNRFFTADATTYRKFVCFCPRKYKKVAYCSKIKEIFAYCPDCQKGPKLKIHVGTLDEYVSPVYYSVV